MKKLVDICNKSDVDYDHFEDVLENYMDDFKPVSKAKWVYHSASSNKILIDSYHPSSFSSKKRMYDEMMNDVKLFLNL